MSVGVGTPEEFKKGKYTVGAVVYAFGVGLTIGSFIMGLYLSIAEVGGVRADMDKEDSHLKTELERIEKKMEEMNESLNGRMDRKLKHHNENKKAHE